VTFSLRKSRYWISRKVPQDALTILGRAIHQLASQSRISRISLSVRNRTLPSMDLFYARNPSARDYSGTRGMPQRIAISTRAPKMHMQMDVRNPIRVSLSLSLSLSLSPSLSLFIYLFIYLFPEDNSIRSARRNEVRHVRFDFPVAKGIALSRFAWWLSVHARGHILALDDSHASHRLSRSIDNLAYAHDRSPVCWRP